eukprot:3463492-Alexandrium_andersonii.AAC.1
MVGLGGSSFFIRGGATPDTFRGHSRRPGLRVPPSEGALSLGNGSIIVQGDVDGLPVQEGVHAPLNLAHPALAGRKVRHDLGKVRQVPRAREGEDAPLVPGHLLLP